MFSVVIGLVLIVVIIMPYDVYAQTLGSLAKEENIFGIKSPFIKVGHGLIAIAINPDTNKVYVANYASNTVSAMDINSMRVKDILVGAIPGYLAVNQDTNRIYVGKY